VIALFSMFDDRGLLIRTVQVELETDRSAAILIGNKKKVELGNFSFTSSVCFGYFIYRGSDYCSDCFATSPVFSATVQELNNRVRFTRNIGGEKKLLSNSALEVGKPAKIVSAAAGANSPVGRRQNGHSNGQLE
jgi:thiol-disulfide isomerase/thioredoxin